MKSFKALLVLAVSVTAFTTFTAAHAIPIGEPDVAKKGVWECTDTRDGAVFTFPMSTVVTRGTHQQYGLVMVARLSEDTKIQITEKQLNEYYRCIIHEEY